MSAPSNTSQNVPKPPSRNKTHPFILKNPLSRSYKLPNITKLQIAAPSSGNQMPRVLPGKKKSQRSCQSTGPRPEGRSSQAQLYVPEHLGQTAGCLTVGSSARRAHAPSVTARGPALPSAPTSPPPEIPLPRPSRPHPVLCIGLMKSELSPRPSLPQTPHLRGIAHPASPRLPPRSP